VLLVAVATAAWARGAWAQDSSSLAWQPAAVFGQIGTSPSTQAATFGLAWDLPCSTTLGSGRLSLYLESAIGRGRTEVPVGGREYAWLTQVGITPVLRWRPDGSDSPPFFEFGIGVNVIVPVFHDDTTRFTTALNFGDHLAVGRNLGKGRRHEIALRFQHFSNAGICEPNPGDNFLQIRYALRLD